jgi:hypothetical protein
MPLIEEPRFMPPRIIGFLETAVGGSSSSSDISHGNEGRNQLRRSTVRVDDHRTMFVQQSHGNQWQ